MSNLFLDTGFLIALEIRSDQNHISAFRYWQNYCDQPTLLVTTTFVFDEITTFCTSRGRHDKAVQVGNQLRTSRLIEMVSVDDQLLNEEWNLFVSQGDKRYSLTDCVSFVAMRNNNIATALTFDRHFTQAGFTALPGPN